MAKYKNIKMRKGSSIHHGKAHSNEHSAWSRRSFIKSLGLAGGGSMMLGNIPVFAAAETLFSKALAGSDNDRILVLIRLKGGNDGLNTIVPVFDYDTYAINRPSLAIPENQLFSLSDDFGMPDYMTPLESMWGDGKMKVIHGVGYPDQSLSHFRSADIWAAASGEDEAIDSGWLGRHFENEYPDFITEPPEFPPAIQIGSLGNQIFDGIDGTSYSFSVANPEQLFEIAQNGWLHDAQNVPDCFYGEQVGFMRGIANATFLYANVINDAYTSSTNDVVYDDMQLSNQLALVARMIKGGMQTKVYLVTLDGFDTHADQIEGQPYLLTDVASAVKNFYDDLAATGMDDKVLSMTFSEFGRRVEQNASDGTDHGSSAPVMMFGPSLNGNGFIGEHPDLNDLDEDGNMHHSTDFRQIYATVLQDWLCLDPAIVDELLLDESFVRLDLGLECQATSVFETSQSNFKHDAHYASDGEIYIVYKLPGETHVNIQLFNILGQPVSKLIDTRQFAGEHRIAIRANSGNLSNGQYVYRIVVNGKPYSKSVSMIR